ncbi:digeranylgeranylglycerophospholipid reductase [Halomicrobium sp. LC1Hm]|uniref:digeranylgeranylglycerophospholipid reductase n=1 Tax=Halomicrobium sp. LC1Hm TaxID=2610902 RepID=UPI0012985476|nr:digeranylgeranylglycerophospholipid reductase [Halomicrobium sp. LC1Hm]QGA82664.1 Digeranylgeranylglycerophospholipid reductase [Halomicrobium sp. LC1Hm]
MSDNYDVVVAGAGPAGAQCARDLADRGYDVVVLETETAAEFPARSDKSTGGTFASMMTAFGIPDDVVMHATDAVVLESPSDHFVQDQPGFVLDFPAFKQFLVDDGRAKGAEYRFDARVRDPIVEGGSVVGVRYNGDETVYGDIVVDATGPAAPLAKELGVVDLERRNHAIGIEYQFEGVELDHPDYADLTDAMMLRLDHDFAPGGYSWIFHTGGDTAKVGVCYIQNERYRDHASDERTVDGYLEHWLDSDPRFADASRVESTQARGSAHVQPPGSMSTDSFVAIGDTVPSVDPVWGEGIDKGMRSARAAAMTADRCLTGGVDTSREAMAVYDDLWHERVAPRQERRLFMTRLLYLVPNERYDQLMRDLNALDRETLSKVNEGSRRHILRLLSPSDLSSLWRYVREFTLPV